MTVPGFSPSATSWQSTVPGWTAKAADLVERQGHLGVSLAGIDVSTERPREGTFRQLAMLEGWWDGVESRTETMSRPDGDGEHVGSTYLAGRTVTASGLIWAPDRRTLLEELEEMGSVLQGSARLGTFYVSEKDRDLRRQCEVRTVQTSTVRTLTDVIGSWSWSLRAADPIRYDSREQQVTVSRGGPDMPVTNAGKRAAVPFLLDLVGPLTNPSFWIDGAQWKLNQTIPAGTTVIAYWSEREVFSGSTSLRFYQQGPWPLLKPGVTQVGLSADAGTGSARVRWRSGWL